MTLEEQEFIHPIKMYKGIILKTSKKRNLL